MKFRTNLVCLASVHSDFENQSAAFSQHVQLYAILVTLSLYVLPKAESASPTHHRLIYR
jgi:hypothetical protein